jgi:eukaryotic-like serine/threonine-protein kinase
MSVQPLAKYRLGKVLGRGGMAIVYEAMLHEGGTVGQRCVVKRILPEVARDSSFVKMFLAEARLSVLLRHPNIVRVFEFGAMQGQPFLAMEHIDGCDLVQIARRCATLKRLIPVEIACRIVAEVAGALEYAHNLHDGEGRPLEIVHRDVSPSNIMMTATGDVKLLDFGIAKAASHMRDDMTRTGTLKGKISYMSPEQAEGDPVDRRSDIFSLGIVLHELLTMRRVFRGEDDLQTLRRIRDANPPPPSAMRPDISGELDAIVLRMLARKREERFQSCAEVAQALAPIVRERGGTADRQRVFVATLEMPTAEQVELLPSLDEDALQDDDVDLPAELAELEVTMAQESPFVPPPPVARSGQIGLGSAIVRDRTETTLSRTTGEMQSIEMPLLAPRSYRRAAIVSGSCVAALVAALGYIWIGEGGRAPSSSLSSSSSLGGASNLTTASLVKPAEVIPAPPPSIASPPALTVSAPAPLPVRLHVAGTDGAQVVQGDHVLGTIPLTTELPPQAGKRALVIRKPGFRSATRVVSGDAHAELEVELARLPRKPLAKSSGSSEGQIKDPF